MTNITISLKKATFSNQSSLVPFWFTSTQNDEGKPYIHLSASGNPKTQVDLEIVPFDVAQEIYWGILSSEIEVDIIAILNKFLGKSSEPTRTVVKESKKETIVEKKETNTVTEEEAKIILLLKQGQAKVIEEVGAIKMFDDKIPSGIKDINYLKKILNAEKSASQPRKKLVSHIENRIALLADNNFVSLNDNDNVIVDIEEETIILNNEPFTD